MHQLKSLENFITIYYCITITWHTYSRDAWNKCCTKKKKNIVLIFMMHSFSWLSLQPHAGDIAALGWWDLFINFGYDLFLFNIWWWYMLSLPQNNSCLSIYSIAECFAFLVCTRWYNPAIHRQSHIRESHLSSMSITYLHWNRGLMLSSDGERQTGMCNLQDVGGHIMKVPFIVFQILLFMRLEV